MLHRFRPFFFAKLLSSAVKPALCSGICVYSLILSAQAVDENTVISYTFDKHAIREDHNRVKPSAVGVMLVEDRFGNDRSAVGLNGHLNSYLSLGVSPLLQPRQATIAIWVRINSRIYAGKGAGGNPILLIKNAPVDDFYTAYSLFYATENQHFLATASRDSLDEALIQSVNQVKFGEWYHLALTSNDHMLAFYVNGKLQGRCKKDFETRFLTTDSMMIGHTANHKNERYTFGIFDDIHIYHRVLSDAEIKALYEAPNPNRNTLIREAVLYWTGIGVGIFAVAFLLVWQRRRQLKRATEKLELNRQLHEMEIRTLKAQMNPHFIFNALNAIQVFIMNLENEKAEVYLAKFSRLIRELLESNANESLSVREETNILNGYLEIESLRFGKSFSYIVRVDERIDSDQTRIPHMLIQPFVENAIWHGLLAKENDRQLEVLLEYDSPKTIRCTIDDNGIGREASALKAQTIKKKSLALSIVQQRLTLMQTLMQVDCRVEITDKTANANQQKGTRVTVIIPILFNP